MHHERMLVVSYHNTCCTYALDRVSNGQPSTKDGQTRQSPLVRQAGEESHSAALGEASEDNAVCRDACVDLGSNQLVDAVHGFEHPLFVFTRIDVAKLKDIEPTRS